MEKKEGHRDTREDIKGRTGSHVRTAHYITSPNQSLPGCSFIMFDSIVVH